MKKIFALLLSSLLLCGCLSACGTHGTAYTVTVENGEGIVLCEHTACAGELVTAAVREGYTLRALYIDGKRIEGDSFVMPARDVSVVAVLDSASDAAHTVSVSESGECGRTVADRALAEAGETVTLTTYVAYGCSLKGYLLNGEELSGNTFVMPDADAVVTILYNELPDTSVCFTISQSYQDATSRWYAGYSETGFTVEAVVEDNILFTDTGYLDSFAYADNIEFIVGAKTTSTAWDGRFKIIADAAGRSEIRRYVNNGWTLANVSMDVTVRRCTLENSGFNGYRASVFLPYSIFGLDYASAVGKLAIAPAMRNTLNGLKTAWGNFSGMHCNWNDSKTHLVALPDGTFTTGDFSVKALFAGDGLLSLARWANFYNDVGAIGDVWSVAETGRDTAYWMEHLELIKESAPETVFFTAELKGSPLAAFSEFMAFAEAFAEELPAARLIAISPVPALSGADPGAAAAYAAMLEDYVSEHEAIGFIDLCSAVCMPAPNRNLYASATSLSEDGYALLGKLIREEENFFGDVGGATWGDSGAYIASGNWTESGSMLTLNSDGTRKIYYRTPLSGDFTFSLQLLARSVYNGDAFPKFGFTVQNGTVAHAFYISGEDGLTAARGGFVPYTLGIFDWNNSAETAVPGLSYTGTQYATLRLEREGNTLAFYINDTCVYAGDLGYGKGEMVVGLFSFNTAITIRNWQCTEEAAA